MIVDVDVHLAEAPGDLAAYAEMPWRRILVEALPNPPWTTTGGIYPRLDPRPEPPTPARAPAELLARLDELGVDAAVVLPGPLLKVGLIHTASYASALARAYNRWLVERWLDGGDRLRGALLAVPQDPTASAREIEAHAAHPRVAAICLPTAGVSRLWGDRAYDPIYQAASAADLPVLLHGADKLMAPSTVNQTSHFASEFDQQVMGQSLVAMANLTHLVGTGVLVRYPELRLAFLGAGISWLSHMMLRLDKEYNENRRDVPFYRDRISLTLRERVWVGSHPIEDSGDPRDLADLVRVTCGIERVVYGSDWPNLHFDTPERLAAALPDDESRRRVMGENALGLLRMTTKVAERG